jgi:hypothetical protein
LVISPRYQRRGAGGPLIKWGIAKSKETRLPIYLTASEQGRRLYSRHGFKEFGFKDWDREEYGFDGPNTVTEIVLKPELGTTVSSPGTSSSSLAIKAQTQ